MELKDKTILDVCCGSRMFWFNKMHPNTLYLDNRTLPPTLQTNGATITVAPDEVMDFRHLELPDSHFKLVVFDPPHIIKRGGKRSWMAEKYGELDKRLALRDCVEPEIGIWTLRCITAVAYAGRCGKISVPLVG